MPVPLHLVHMLKSKPKMNAMSDLVGIVLYKTTFRLMQHLVMTVVLTQMVAMATNKS